MRNGSIGFHEGVAREIVDSRFRTKARKKSSWCTVAYLGTRRMWRSKLSRDQAMRAGQNPPWVSRHRLSSRYPMSSCLRNIDTPTSIYAGNSDRLHIYPAIQKHESSDAADRWCMLPPTRRGVRQFSTSKATQPVEGLRNRRIPLCIFRESSSLSCRRCRDPP